MAMYFIYEGRESLHMQSGRYWPDRSFLKQEIERVRQHGIGARASFVVPALIEALSDPHAEVRVAAARSLAKIGPQALGAAPSLVITLRDDDRRVQVFAARALYFVALNLDQTITKNLELLGHETPEIQRIAKHNLELMRDDLILPGNGIHPTLLREMEQVNSEVKRLITQVLETAK